MEHSERKTIRLQEYDYSAPGAYFVTICTKNRQRILSDVVPPRIDTVGEGLCALPQVELTDVGRMVEKSIWYLHEHISGFSVDKYVIMPDHVHLLVQISALPEKGGHRGPPLPKILGQFKSYTTHCHRSVLWQRSYNDHVIRGEQDYREAWNYIDGNPVRWQQREQTAPVRP